MASIISFFTGINRAVGDLLPPRAGDTIRDLIVGLEGALNFSQFNAYLASFEAHEGNINNPHEVSGKFFIDTLLQYIYQQYTYIASPVLSYDDWLAQYLYNADFLELIRRIVLNWFLYRDAYETGIGPLPSISVVTGSALILDGSQIVDITGSPVLEPQTLQPVDGAGDEVGVENQTLSLTNQNTLVSPLVDDQGGVISLNITDDWGVEYFGDGMIDVIFPTWYHTFTGFLQRMFDPQGDVQDTPIVKVTNNTDVQPISYTQSGFPSGTDISGAGQMTGLPKESSNGYWTFTSVDAVGTTQSLSIQARVTVTEFLETTPDIVFAANTAGSTITIDNPPIYSSSWYLPDPYLVPDTSDTASFYYQPIQTPLLEINFVASLRFSTNLSDTSARNLIKFQDSGNTTSLTVEYIYSNSQQMISVTYARSGYASQQQSYRYSGQDIAIFVSANAVSVYGYQDSVMMEFGSFDLSASPLGACLSTFVIGQKFGLCGDDSTDGIESLIVYPLSTDDLASLDTVANALLSTH